MEFVCEGIVLLKSRRDSNSMKVWMRVKFATADASAGSDCRNVIRGLASRLIKDKDVNRREALSV